MKGHFILTLETFLNVFILQNVLVPKYKTLVIKNDTSYNNNKSS
jgi:hypothetical protein